MPSLSPTMESGTIASWTLGEGDSFGPGDVLCSVETDKATVDFEAQDDGVVAKILADAGPDEIQCGHPIMITVEDEDDVGAFKDYKIEEAVTAEASPAPPAEAAPVQSSSPAPTPPPAAPTAAAALSSSPSSSSGRVIASPLAHLLAKEMSHDLSQISGTGPGGRIIAADVREFIPSAAATAAATTGETAAAAAPGVTLAPPQPGDGFTDYPISQSSKEVAARLAQSKRNVPHYYLTVDICMDGVLAMNSKLAPSLGEDASLGTYEFMIKAAAASMKAVPAANASWMDTVVRVYDSVDVNVVVGSGDDLYTPILRNCGDKGLRSISDDLKSAMSSYDNDEVTSDFASMGTMTIMNLGMFGVKSCAPIIREPQAIALAVGALENRIVPGDGDELYKSSVMMTATLSCDHRVVDGAVGAQWLSAFKSHLEDPTTLLL